MLRYRLQLSSDAEDKTLSIHAVNHPSIPLSDAELAVRGLPLRAIFGLEVLARCDGRLHLAAKILGISKSALSTQITRMEGVLGVDVVKKAQMDGRRFELTDTGEMLVSALRTALPNLVTLTNSFHHAMTAAVPEERRRDQRSSYPRRRVRSVQATLPAAIRS